MLPREDEVPLEHMRDHAIEASDMVKDKNREDLDLDRRLNLSLVRLVEIIGEAANRVARQTQEAHPSIPCFAPCPVYVPFRSSIAHSNDETYP